MGSLKRKLHIPTPPCFFFFFSFCNKMNALKQSLLKNKHQVTLALLKPDICANAELAPKIKQAISKNGLTIIKEKDIIWTQEQAGQFYSEHEGKFFYHRLCGYMTR
jgi:nucleoside-diphosphate kinase